MNRLRIKGEPLMRRFLLNYVLLIVVASVGFFPVYHSTAQSMRTYMLSEQRRTLEARQHTLENDLARWKGIAETLRGSNEIAAAARLSRTKLRTEDYYTLMIARKRFRTEFQLEDLAGYLLMFRENDLMILPDVFYDNAATAYGREVIFDGMTYAQLRAWLTEGDETFAFAPQTLYARPFSTLAEKQVLPCAIRVGRLDDSGGSSMLLRRRNDLYLLCLLGASALAGRFADESVERVRLLDQDGVELAQWGEGREDLVTLESAGASGMRVEIGVSSARLTANVSRVTRNIRLFYAGSVLTGLLVALLLSWRNALPLRRMRSALDDASPETRAMRDVYERFHHTLSDMRALREKADQMQSVRRGALFDKLIGGIALLPEEQEQLGVDFPCLQETFFLALVCLQGDEAEGMQARLQCAMAVEILEKTTPGAVYAHPLAHNQVALLLGGEEAEQALEAGVRRVEQEMRCRVRTSVSAPGHAPGDLFLCYRQAKGMLRYPGEQGGVRRYHEEEAGSGLVSLGTLNRLYMALAAGDEAASCAVLDEIRRSCEQSGGMSEIALESLLTSVSSTLCLAARDQGLSCRPVELRDSGSVGLGELFDRLRGAAAELCLLSLKRRTGRQACVMEEIINYIEKHCREPQLSARALSEAVGLSEKYLYAFVKENTGRTVGSLIEEARMERAKALLLAGCSVAEAAQAVGYELPNSFYKAFKRCTGVSPGVWRQQAERETGADGPERPE